MTDNEVFAVEEKAAAESDAAAPAANGGADFLRPMYKSRE